MTRYWMYYSTPPRYTVRPFLTLSALRSTVYRYLTQTWKNVACTSLLLQGLFRQRNPGFMGTSSVVGHSLGSLILFDLLSGQTEEKEVEVNVETSPLVKPKWDKDLGIGEVFAKLGIEEHLDPLHRPGGGGGGTTGVWGGGLEGSKLTTWPKKETSSLSSITKGGLQWFPRVSAKLHSKACLLLSWTSRHWSA